ncbi:MAG TPA: hypothetical protein VFA98_11165, partial [Thermoanaerobaculia bacterium]|nr:hypothetical protein [Thermoanaerobaculia bacterium]
AETNLLTFLPAEEPGRAAAAADLARALAGLVESGRRRVVLVARVNGGDPDASPLAGPLVEAGFVRGSRGYMKRRAAPPAGLPPAGAGASRAPAGRTLRPMG